MGQLEMGVYERVFFREGQRRGVEGVGVLWYGVLWYDMIMIYLMISSMRVY